MLHYSAKPDRPRPEPASRRGELLRELGLAVRRSREAEGLSRRALAEKTRVSERFLAELEGGSGNISVVRLEDVAEALGTTGAELLAAATAKRDKGVIALVGLRGAGKTSVGAELAEALSVPFVELDELVAREAGMTLATIFEVHGEGYFREVERRVVRRLLARGEPCVLATGGSIVSDGETWSLLRRHTRTVWLRATAKDHWDRVVSQGDARPMRGRPRARAELEALLEARGSHYAEAELTVDTSGHRVADVARRVAEACGR